MPRVPHSIHGPPRQIVPDDDHGDAPCQPDEDQSGHVFLMPRQEQDGQEEHQYRTDHPVLDQGKNEHPDVFEDETQFFIFDLGKGRVHHQNQSNGNGYVRCAH
jgi:hypothetical protein